MATILMQDAQGEQYDVPEELAERAQAEGGLRLVTVEMRDEAGETYDIPVAEVQKAYAAGLREPPSSVPRPRADPIEKEFEAAQVKQQEGRGLVEKVSDPLRQTFLQGGPSDIRNIANAVGPVLGSINVGRSVPSPQMMRQVNRPPLTVPVEVGKGAVKRVLQVPVRGAPLPTPPANVPYSALEMAAEKGLGAARASGLAAKKSAIAAQLAARGAEKAVTAHPYRTIATAALVDHLTGGRGREYLRRLFTSEDR